MPDPAEREPVEHTPEREAAAERGQVADFMERMVMQQPGVVQEEIGHASQLLTAETGQDISPLEVGQHLDRQLEMRMTGLGPTTATELAGSIRREELNPQSGIWTENANASSMIGKVARSHRENLRGLLVEVARGDRAASTVAEG